LTAIEPAYQLLWYVLNPPRSLCQW